MSVLAVQPDGKSVEVGLIGKEGFVGLPLLVGYHTSPTRVVTQGDGSAYRCDAEALIQILRKSPDLTGSPGAANCVVSIYFSGDAPCWAKIR